jgi:hypothetical protein
LRAISRLAVALNGVDGFRLKLFARLRALCERWIYATCLGFALAANDRRRSGFNYQYSVFQLELSRNLLFRRGTTMDEVYQKLIERHPRAAGAQASQDDLWFFASPAHTAKRGRERTEVFNAIQAPSYNLTVFKIKWGSGAI